MSTIRLSGMASGLDTDSIVEQLMNVEKEKYYKVERQLYKTEYQIEAYRGVTTKLQEFKSSYLDILGKTNMTSSSTYRKFDAKITDAQGASSKAVSVTSTSGANAGTHTIKVEQVASKAIIQGSKVTGNLRTDEIEDLNLAGKSINFTVDGKSKTITLNDYESIEDLQSDLQTKLDTAFGNGFNGTSGKLNISVEGNALNIQSVNGSTNITITDDEDVLKLKNSSTSLTTSTSLEDLSSAFTTKLTFGKAFEDDTEEDTIKFTINGKEFTFDKSDTLKDIMNEINNDSDINAKLEYNSTSGTFRLSSNDYGEGEKLVVEDVSGNFMEAIGLYHSDEVYTEGRDTKAIVDGVQISRSAATFNIDGVTYQANDVTDGEVTVDLTLNTDEVFDSIVNFIQSYNTLIGEINDLISAEYDRDYQPLTEDERGQMTEEQIKKWDEKAKTGLLHNDQMLSSLLTELRSCFSQSVSGVGMTLSDIGLKTGTYTEKGKIVLDESAKSNLKNALADNLDAVVDLFTKKSEDYAYSSRTYTTDQRKVRMAQEGLTNRLSDVLDGYISTYRDASGYKGKLLEKAGIKGDTTETTSTLSKLLVSYDEKLDDISDLLDIKYERYYAKFSAMETAIQRANSQASYLNGLFGGNTKS